MLQHVMGQAGSGDAGEERMALREVAAATRRGAIRAGVLGQLISRVTRAQGRERSVPLEEVSANVTPCRNWHGHCHEYERHHYGDEPD